MGETIDFIEYHELIMIRLPTLKSGRKLVTDSDTETWVETWWAWGTWGYSVISITTSGIIRGTPDIGDHQGNTRLCIPVLLTQFKLIVICGYYHNVCSFGSKALNLHLFHAHVHF